MTIPDTAYTKDANLYAEELLNEYRQCIDEGLNVQPYEALFREIDKLDPGAVKNQMADALFHAVENAGTVSDYPYNEPSELEAIRALCTSAGSLPAAPDRKTIEPKIRGAWVGRICGCLLGKPIEGIRTEDLNPFLQMSGNMPLHRYPLRADLTPEVLNTIAFDLKNKEYADELTSAPADDDTNYTVLAQALIERFGRTFKSEDVLTMWMREQPSTAYFTAEQVAYRNRTAGLLPPYTATVKNPFREWIGAQIRGDYFGYICPGNPQGAAELAWRDARISHVKNGIYGEMFVSAMLAAAAVTDDIREILAQGLAQIPQTSRLYARVREVIEGFRNGVSSEDCIRQIHTLYDEHTGYGWCHTISNAMIVTAALLYGGGDFGKSICLAVSAAFDTDCNGATVGSILGMRGGIDSIDPYWYTPLHGKLRTQILSVGTVQIEMLVQKTLDHIFGGEA